MPDLLLLTSIGLFSGLLAGLLGIGGGVIIVPLLIEFFSFHQFPAQLIMPMSVGTSLTVLLFTTSATAFRFHIKGLVQWEKARTLMLPVAIGAVLGNFILDFMNPGVVKILFACFASWVAFRIFKKSEGGPVTPWPARRQLFFHGVFFGTLSGMLGAGGGVLIIPFLAHHGLSMRQASGTSSATIVATAICGCLTAIVSGIQAQVHQPTSLGYAYLPAVACVTLGSLVTIQMGFHIGSKLSNLHLRRVFVIVLVAIIIRMFYLGIQNIYVGIPNH